MSDFDESNYESLCETSLCQIYVRDGFCIQQTQQNCYFVHGDFCDECQQYALHPFNIDLRKQHEIDCMINKLMKKLDNIEIDTEKFNEHNDIDEIYDIVKSGSICPHYERNGRCSEQEEQNCQFIHGDRCDICGYYSLHPFCEQDRERHIKKCIEDFEMKQTCAICLEIMGQTPESNRNNGDHDECEQIEKSFGLMKNCCHIFCWDCIQTWRTSSNAVECPICRIPSETVIKTVFQ
ncbi:putative E3 ubiquitin-protein ligase makorin-2 [Dermatophagoides farinae]|uniref:RING-type E3 ubiquitin transferase n=1 Tax=Dermatophagoides farinae TaxID=6954 RepID=A0A922I1Q5_DERFA|nr:probable E3 ubiquitin-protein ligase makorin-2 [Dermatophagoides farinae]KAH7641755.1 hypothetical protein HUG17_4800 [Dermatophagoides farinae]KAH9518253.1 putative E3 ubiquitin-protein ligase makorin-2 [Dermatophagoides farinae]